MGVRALLERFDAWRGEGRTLVLATVIETGGSTYSKPGHRILIADSHEWQGLVSGGCLEGDLALQAEQVRRDGIARVITYDLRGNADGVFGLGIGCDGLLRILLQRLDPAHDFAPFAAIAAAIRGSAPAALLAVTAPGGGLAVGDTLVRVAGSTLASGLQPRLAEQLAPLLERSATPVTGTGTVIALPAPFSPATALLTAIEPLPRLLVLGAGPDVAPLLLFARQLDYHVTVYDHRPASTGRPDLAAADTLITAPPGELPARVDLDGVAAAVVMSHHLDSDRSYLQALAGTTIGYLALLGPRHRRERLLRELGDAGRGLAGRLRGPAGLDLGHATPEGIALAIAAELVATRHGRTARPLSGAGAREVHHVR
jgi:xanthine/CO dehydrogenase XdhC/CoxF family maturation factor